MAAREETVGEMLPAVPAGPIDGVTAGEAVVCASPGGLVAVAAGDAVGARLAGTVGLAVCCWPGDCAGRVVAAGRGAPVAAVVGVGVVVREGTAACVLAAAEGVTLGEGVRPAWVGAGRVGLEVTVAAARVRSLARVGVIVGETGAAGVVTAGPG